MRHSFPRARPQPSVLFFNEALYRPKQRHLLAGSRAIGTLDTTLPDGCRLIRRQFARALILSGTTNGVIGVLDTPPCLPRPVGEVGGIAKGTYLEKARANDMATFCVMCHREGFCFVVVRTDGTATLGPVEVRTRPETSLGKDIARRHFQATSASESMDMFFAALSEHAGAIEGCSQFYVVCSSQQDDLWLNAKRRKDQDPNICPIDFDDPRWMELRPPPIGPPLFVRSHPSADVASFSATNFVESLGYGELRLS